MKRSFLTRIFAYVLTSCCALCLFVGCNDVQPPDETSNKVDVGIFMGQSNMAGRGEARDSVVCVEGHGYEFRAVADSTKLYPVVEPFGATENNDMLADTGSNGDGKKSGSFVSAFVEGYYEQSKTPLVCVSASVGGTGIAKWAPDTDYFVESKRRLTAAVDYLLAHDYVVGNVFMVWCQGEADATRWQNGEVDYFVKLQAIVDGLGQLGNGYGVSNCFVITPSEYSKGYTDAVQSKINLVNDIIDYCADTTNNCVLVSMKFRNVPLVMRDDPHFHQGIYNVTGYDAGTHTAQYLASGNYPQCNSFVLGEDVALADKFGVALEFVSQ